MTVATFTNPNFTTQSAAQYKANIDGGFMVGARIIDAFAAHEQAAPNMTVRLDAGYIWDGTTLLEIAAQNTTTISAPIGNPRIDRVVVDTTTGVVSVVTGTQSASPVAPAIPSGKMPIARVALTAATTSITNAIITDERVGMGSGSGGGSGSGTVVMTLTTSQALTATDVGKLIYITSGPCDVTLPALASVSIGATFNFVSSTFASQRIFPNGAELLENVNDFQRLPSFDSCEVKKVSTTAWRMTRRPTTAIGETKVWCGSAGTIAQVAGAGWLAENAQALNRVSFGNLFGVIGVTWGAGDGSTTFNVPDARGRVSVGSGQGTGLTNRVLGTNAGEESHVLTQAELAAHTHSVSGSSSTQADVVAVPATQITSTIIGQDDPSGLGVLIPSSPPVRALDGLGVFSPASLGYYEPLRVTIPGHTHSISLTAGSIGSSSGHNNMQPYLVKQVFIKA